MTRLLEFLRATIVRPRGLPRIPVAIAWTMGLVCLAALVHRFRFAPDLTDESFSVALPYRFVLGDKPFVDEICIQQTAGILLVPFVWIFVKITGGTTGLVFYVRVLHLLVKGIAAIAVYAAAKRWLTHRSSAIALAFLPFALVPHSLANVGYNVLGSVLIVAGTFFAAAAVTEQADARRHRLLFWSGVVQGVMAFAYPPMAVAPLLTTLLVLICSPARRLAATGAFLLGGAVTAAMILPSLRFGGVAGVKRALSWGVHAQQSHSKEAFLAVVETLSKNTPTFVFYAVPAIALAWVLRSRSLVAVVLSVLSLAVATWNHGDSNGLQAALWLVVYASIFAPFVLLIAKPDGALVRGAVMVLVPSYAAGIAAGFTSTQGASACGLGFHAGMVFFALLSARALERAGADATLCLLPAGALMVGLVYCCYDYVYRDAPLSLLTETVHVGPFKGIRTTPERARELRELQDIVTTYDQPGGHILFLYEQPGFYLASKMPPSAHCVWEMTYGDQPGMLAFWKERANGRGIVVRIKGTPVGRIDPLLTSPDRRLKDTSHFTVYREP